MYLLRYSTVCSLLTYVVNYFVHAIWNYNYMLFIIVLAEPSRLAAVGGWERACPRSHMCSAATDDGWDG